MQHGLLKSLTRAIRVAGLQRCRLPPTFSARKITTDTNATCPSCGQPLPTRLPTCTSCWTIYPLPSEIPYHSLLDLSEEPNPFVVDLKTLRQNFLKAQRLCHPDAWSGKGQKEQAVAEGQSSLLNTAYKTLSSPVLRAEYLLGRTGRATQETDQLENQDLIMEVMEAREELDDATTERDVEDVRERNQKRVSETLLELESAFGRENFDAAKSASVRLKYWEGIEDAARAKLRDS
ncbi:hypothetical protein FRB93_013489 [Tulasnella sp. JGI-2019a]|nr:hypothetical protein FRB93_013489 [Tulasnella sp. JGI-2019a]